MARFETFDAVLHAYPTLQAEHADVLAYLRGPDVLSRTLRDGLEHALAAAPARPPTDRRGDPPLRLARSPASSALVAVAAAVPLPPGEFDAKAELPLARANDALAGAYDTHAIPHELDGSTFEQLFDPDALRPLTTGLPADVALGALHLTAAPSIAFAAGTDRPIAVVPIRVDFVRAPDAPSPVPPPVVTSLSGTVRVQINVAFERVGTRVAMVFDETAPPPSPGRLRFAVAAGSPVQPIDPAALDAYFAARDASCAPACGSSSPTASRSHPRSSRSRRSTAPACGCAAATPASPAA